MSSGAASASVSAYNALPSQAGGASGPTAASFISPNLAAGYGTSGGINGQQNGTAAALNPDSVSSNQSPDQYRSLMHQEMIAPAPPSVAAADSAQIFKIGNSGLVAITIAGVVIGVTSFVGVQAIYEAMGQRHKHDARRVQQRQDDKNVELADGRQRAEKAEAGFVQSATQHGDAVTKLLDTDFANVGAHGIKELKTAVASQLRSGEAKTASQASGESLHKVRGFIAKQLAHLDVPNSVRANSTLQHAKLFLGENGSPVNRETYEQRRATLPTDYAIDHEAFVSKAVNPIAHKWVAIK